MTARPLGHHGPASCADKCCRVWCCPAVWLTAGCRLLRCQPQPGGQIATSLKAFSSGDGGRQRRCILRADTRDCGRQPGCLVGPGLCGEFGVKSRDAAVQFLPLTVKVIDQQPVRVAQPNPCPPANSASRRCSSLRRPCGARMPRSSRMARSLVDQRCSFAPQPISGTIQALHVQLGLTLQIHEPHGGTGCGLGDRFGIAVIVFLSFDIGPHVFRRHQTNLIPMIAQRAGKRTR